jgi:hypothetical protein
MGHRKPITTIAVAAINFVMGLRVKEVAANGELAVLLAHRFGAA